MGGGGGEGKLGLECKVEKLKYNGWRSCIQDQKGCGGGFNFFHLKITKELDSQLSFKISTIVLYQKQDLMFGAEESSFRYAENFHISSHPKFDLRCSYMYMYI